MEMKERKEETLEKDKKGKQRKDAEKKNNEDRR